MDALGLAFAFVAAAVVIVAHHRVKHRNDAHLSPVEKFFQVSDVSNHETWAVACVAFAAGVLTAAAAFTPRASGR